MPVISVDLAYKNYRDVGIAVLEAESKKICCEFHKISLSGPPDSSQLADYLNDLCRECGANALLIDGPHAWKSPDNGLEHARLCERALNTPAKTGLPEVVKPANYGPFVRFSIDVFGALQKRGWTFYAGLPNSGERTLFESFPLSAWRSLGIRGLPAKSKHKPDDLKDRLARLLELAPISCDAEPTHDELQALVSGLAGVAYEHDFTPGFAAAGVSPSLLEGYLREGFIVNPAPAAWHARFSG